MKKVLQIFLAAVGGLMTGAFSNQLDTIIGCICFAVGILMLTTSITMTTDTNYRNR